jgi:hypothetical protein
LTGPLQDWILQLPNVTKASYRFGGTEFQVHGLEFMHAHRTSHLDIRLSKENQERMLKEGKAEPHRFAPQAGWVTFRIRSEKDTEQLGTLGLSQSHQKMGTVSALFNRD